MNKKVGFKKTGIKIMFLFLAFTFMLFISLNYISAYQWLCLTYGQSVPNENDPRYTCNHDSCQVCVTDNYYPTHFGKCQDLQGCQYIDGNGTGVDTEPPSLNVKSPLDNEVYDGNVLFDIDSNEPAALYYIDNVNGRGKWKRLSSPTKSFERDIRLKDGLNNLTIKGVDRKGNEALIIRQFFVDTKEPNIKKTSPESGFVGSVFMVFYDEENVQEIKLHYGNDELGFKEIILNDCSSGDNQECFIDVDLSEYDGKEIKYWFEVRDVAGNIDTSKEITLFVDESEPVIVSFNYTNDGKFINFNLEIDEAFLEEIVYSYTDEREIKRERKLCSNMKGKICKDKAGFKDGEQEVDIIVRDQAGNEAFANASFFVDTKAPKIKRTYPKKGFANGLFDVEFDEENPEQLILHYGIDGDMREAELDLEECSINKKTTFCSVNVDLEDFEGENIMYWFELTDIVGNKDESKKITLEVDNAPPVLNNIDSFWEQNGNKIIFMFDITEENFDEVNYIDQSDLRPREKRLCSRLKEGLCNTTKTFRKGSHTLDVQILDEAGNAVSYRVEFDVL